MQQPPSLSSNIRYLEHIVYSLSSANASVVAVDSVGQAVKENLPLGCWLSIYYSNGLHLWLLGVVVYLTLLEKVPLKTVEVQTEYLDYCTKNIQSFGLSLICVVININKTTKRAFQLASQ